MGEPPGAPLSTLLSRTLAAFERDYRAGERVPPLALWSNLLRFVDDDGIPLRDAHREWRERYGADVTDAVRSALTAVTGTQ